MKKIGILDSGIGGLTILSQLMKLNLDAHYFYISDSDNVPYGGKDQGFMLERTSLMIEKLLEEHVSTIVIACNTLTVETISKLRSKYEVNFVGIEPYVNYLNKHTFNSGDDLAMILTPATFKSKRFTDLLAMYDPNKKIKVYPLPMLAMLIEQLKLKSFESLEKGIKGELLQLAGKGHSHLILGCTHYPIIEDYIRTSLDISTIDPHKEVINQIIEKAQLEQSKSTCQEFMYNPNLSQAWTKTRIDSFPFKL